MSGPGRAFVIAEAGVNHNGSCSVAKELVDAAEACGADAIKFQTFRASKLVSRSARKAEYQKLRTKDGDTQYGMLKALELSDDDHIDIMRHCDERGICFLSSPFDEQSAEFLDRHGVTQFKVPSGELTNHPLLAHIAKKGKPIIMSTGMATLGEVDEALDVIFRTGNSQVTLLHCVTEYPAPFDEINLRAMLTLRDAFKIPVGYSDHSPGVEIAIAAAALGAEVIEKHLTLDKAMHGPDHSASINPTEFKLMVESIRNVEASLGNGAKRPAPCELKNLDIARKSLVTIERLERGDRISIVNVAAKRPGHGIQPKHLKDVMNLRVNRDVEPDEVITWELFS